MDLFEHKKTLKIKDHLIQLDGPKICGIINITPDSFYSGSRLMKTSEILKKTEKFITEGAYIIEIGGYSSRPGAGDISPEEELQRITEPIKLIKKHFNEIILSVDTFRPQVAEKAIETGADIINDITAGGQDGKMFEVIKKYKVPYIIMHMQGTPQTMHLNPFYEDVLKEILHFFSLKLKNLHNSGIPDVIIDPGFGFGKTIEHNFHLLKNLNLFKTLNAPIMVGISRKSMIYKTLQTSPEFALTGTTALNTIALLNGADILRVHDVKEARETIDLIKLYLQSC